MPPYIFQSIFRDLTMPSPGAKVPRLIGMTCVPPDWADEITHRQDRRVVRRHISRSIMWGRFIVGHEKNPDAQGLVFSTLLSGQRKMTYQDVEEPGTPRCLGGERTTIIPARKNEGNISVHLYPRKNLSDVYASHASFRIPMIPFGREIRKLPDPDRAIDVWSTRPLKCIVCVHPRAQTLFQVWVPLVRWSNIKPPHRTLDADEPAPFLSKGQPTR